MIDFVMCRDSVRDPIPQKNEVLVEHSFVFGNASIIVFQYDFEVIW